MTHSPRNSCQHWFRAGAACRPVWLAALTAAVCLATGCGPATGGPRSRFDSVSAEPELRGAERSVPEHRRRLVPQVIGRPTTMRPDVVVAAGRAARHADSHAAPVRPVSNEAAAAEPAHLPPPDEGSPQTAEIRDMLAGYLKDFNRHDAAAAARHWTPAAENLDLDTGELTRGREAVQEVFASLFETDAEAAIDIDLGSIRPLRDDVAVVDGVSRVSYGDGETAGSRFSAVVVRELDRWQLASVREAACPVPAVPRRPLDELAWLVGSWENVGDGVTASGHCSWSGDRAFLARYHVVAPAGRSGEAPAAGDGAIPALLPAGAVGRRELTEIIGWDPEREAIRSWIFSSDGRFAEGTWTRDGGSWVVHLEGHGLDAGRNATCTLTPEGRDALVVRAEGVGLTGLLPPACGFARTAR